MALRSGASKRSASSMRTEARVRQSRKGLRKQFARQQANEKSDTLFYLENLGIAKGEVLHVFTRASEFLSFHSPADELTLERVQEVTDMLRDCGMPDSAIARAYVSHPPLVVYNADRLRSLFQYLYLELNVPTERAVESAIHRPALLTVSPNGELQQMIDWLRRNHYSEAEVQHYVLNTL